MHVWPFYAGLAIAAGLSTWRNDCLRPIGLTVLASCAISNAAHWWLSPLERPAAYTVAEVAVMSVAFLAHVCGGPRLLVGVVAVSVMSVTFNLYAAWIGPLTIWQTNAWEIATNLCFATECLLVIGMALHARSRTGTDNGRDATAVHALAAKADR